ncbi:MAG: cupin domain-containing protein [Hyphomicrobiales bacterium]|nr:cupin domain-containing protein [Hyphomicrobiales bacterium]
MTRLIVYAAKDARDIQLDTREIETIRKELNGVGAHIERWEALHPLKADATNEEILAAYAPEIERLKRERGYVEADVISVKPGNPNWPTLRQKFLSEHTHDEDEVRYFVEGSGAFYLHIGERVLEIVGEAGDLLSVPTGTAHWFDGGEAGHFTVIRVFTTREGWVAHFTGDTIADNFPKYETAV